MVSINTTYKLPAGYPDSRKTVGKILVAHETATPNAPAKNIAAYEHNGGYKSAYVHFAVDDKGAYQIGTPGYRVWGAGSVNSYAPVQIELCNFTDKAKGLKAYANYISMIREYAAYWKIPLTLDDSNKTAGIKSHLWCSQNYGGSDHADPYSYLSQLGISKAQFAKDIKNGINGQPSPAPAPAPAPAPSGQIAVDGLWGSATTRALQSLYGLTVDGVVSGQPHGTAYIPSKQTGTSGSNLIRTIQKRLKINADGYCGPATVKAMQKHAGTIVDGVISKPSNLVSWMQKKINGGKKPF